jgi:hypothetical protein
LAGCLACGRCAGSDRANCSYPFDERQRELIQYDLGHATISMMLAAADHGIGTCHSAVSDQALARTIL